MKAQKAALITATKIRRVDSNRVMTEKAIGGDDLPVRELVFGRWVIEPDVDLARHTHSADTAAYCVRGSCSFRTGPQLERQFEMGPGDYVYIAAGTLHTEATGADGVELIFARDRNGGETVVEESA